MSKHPTPVQREAARLVVKMDRDRGRQPSAVLLELAREDSKSAERPSRSSRPVK